MAPIAPVAAVAARSTSAVDVARDLVALTKPRITVIVLLTAACGMKLASRAVHGRTWLCTMVGTALIGGAANARHLWLERDVDAKMTRTRNRPLPAGRLAPGVALGFGLGLALLSLPILVLGVNAVAGALGAVALTSYVLMYTPMKRHSVRALWVGAIPGAIPPLLGWSAVTGRIDAGGLALFAVLFLWQIPHFLAIAVFRASDYANAGLKVVPVEHGDRATDSMMLRYAVAVAASSFLPLGAHLGSRAYVVVAALLGLAFVAACARGPRMAGAQRIRWARGVFAFSIVYLVALFTTLVATA
ncbi:MAG: heme o synthase [Polyangiales bacterium]